MTDLHMKLLAAVLGGMVLAGSGAGLGIWRDVAVLNTKLDTFMGQVRDHETRLRALEGYPGSLIPRTPLTYPSSGR